MVRAPGLCNVSGRAGGADCSKNGLFPQSIWYLIDMPFGNKDTPAYAWASMPDAWFQVESQ
jgi:hypothetical protein